MPSDPARGRTERSGTDSVQAVQERNVLPPPIAMVIRSGQQVLLTSGQQVLLTEDANRFLRKVEFTTPEGGEAQRLRPAGPTSPVVIDPLVRFGRPAVDHVATKRLWELFDAGEPLDEIATGYQMSPELVRSAVAYEQQLHSLAA